MSASLVVYNFKCRKRGCQNFVEKKGDLCDDHLLEANSLVIYGSYDSDCIRSEAVIAAIRKLERKLRNK